ncbi:MAG: recombinase RecA [bacterium]|nr:recombinase RecA [bacterium]
MSKPSGDGEDKVASQKNAAKLAAVTAAMQQIEKDYGKGSIMRLGASGKLTADVVPTGSIALDIALGIGGIPRGRVIEVFGPEASGKTSIVLHIIAEVQKRGGIAAFIDAEHALDPLRAQAIGVNIDDLLISQPDTGEQALEIAETLIRSGGVDIVAIDSVAALVPRAEIEGDMGDAMMGMQARLMSQALRKLTGAIHQTKTIAMFTNQMRQKIGVMFGNPETTTGGLALKFYASVRLDIRKIENIKDGDKVVASRHRVRVVKNKMAPPFRVAEFDMDTRGISRTGELLDIGLELGLIEKSGAFFRYSEMLLGQGREAAKEMLTNDKKIAKKLEDDIRAKSAAANADMVVGHEETPQEQATA